jgi:hypothetical protein
MSFKSRRNRFTGDGEYLLPSERSGSHIDDIDGDEEIFAGNDDLDTAIDIARAMPTSDSLAHKAMLRQRKEAEREDVSPHVAINPRSANRGTLGGQQRVFNNLSAGPLNMQVALWNADADVECLPVTVTFGSVTPVGNTFGGDVPTSALFRPYGIIQWGTRAAAINAEVDIGLGTQLTLGASMVSLQVALESVAAAPSGFMDLTGMLSFHPVIRFTPVTRTKYFDADGIATSVTFAVPKFAKNVVLWRATSAQGLDIDFLNSQGFVVYSFSVAAGTTMLTPVPLTGEVYFIKVTRQGVGFMGSLTALFQLSL